MKNLLIYYIPDSGCHHHNSSAEANKVILGVFILLNVIFAIMCIWALIKWLKNTRRSYWEILTNDEATFIQFFFPFAMILIDGIVLLVFFGWLVSLTF